MREKYRGMRAEPPCHICQGKRLRPEALAVTIGEKSIYDIGQMPVLTLREWVYGLRGTNGHAAVLNERDQTIAYQIVKEIDSRVGFLADVGLDYLSMAR